jgi:hypothetical protein
VPWTPLALHSQGEVRACVRARMQRTAGTSGTAVGAQIGGAVATENSCRQSHASTHLHERAVHRDLRGPMVGGQHREKLLNRPRNDAPGGHRPVCVCVWGGGGMGTHTGHTHSSRAHETQSRGSQWDGKGIHTTQFRFPGLQAWYASCLLSHTQATARVRGGHTGRRGVQHAWAGRGCRFACVTSTSVQ